MTVEAEPETIHGTAVAWHGRGVLIRGESGTGKSDLAFRVIALGAMLVADDRVRLMRRGDALWLAPPPRLAGIMELRGIGLARVPYLVSARLALLLDLVEAAAVERMPEISTEIHDGLSVPRAALSGHDLSAPQKLLGLLRARPDL